MFASMQTAPHMTWHHENQSQGILRHPSDDEAWMILPLRMIHAM